jgi:hypothetical protein
MPPGMLVARTWILCPPKSVSLKSKVAPASADRTPAIIATAKVRMNRFITCAEWPNSDYTGLDIITF